jgi:serine phosphatase RsbU (regulator of sigma subunit)/CHASE1-domain containing sensor protein
LLVTFTLHGMVSEWEIGWKSAEFQHAASINGQAVHRAIRYSIEVLQSVRSVATKDDRNHSELQAFAIDALRRHPTIRAIEFTPVVSAKDLTTYPLVKIAPSLSAAGRDLGEDPVRLAAMDLARDLDTPVATALMSLDEAGGETGWALALPVYSPGPAPRDSAERRARLAGFVHEVIVARELVNAALRSYKLDSMAVSLQRGDSPAAFVEVVRLEGPAAAVAGAPIHDDRFRWEGTFQAAETSWRIVVRAREAYLGARKRPLSRVILAGGLLLTLLFSFRFARLLEADRRMREENERYTRELADRDARLREELALARVIQKALLPSEIPTIPGLEIGLSFVPSGEIGGDYFDFIPDREGKRLDVVFADLCGHGVPAALLFAIFRTLAGNAFRAGNPPAATLVALNRQLTKTFPKGRFASTFFSRIDARNGTISYVKASQESGLVLGGDGSVTMLDQGDVLLGAFDPDIFGDPEYREVEVRLKRGDVVILFTDGIVEVEDSGGRQLGVDGLLKWLGEERGCAAQKLVDRLHERTVDYAGTSELKDDFTVMAIRMTGE